jgi:hypothetical protein
MVLPSILLSFLLQAVRSFITHCSLHFFFPPVLPSVRPSYRSCVRPPVRPRVHRPYCGSFSPPPPLPPPFLSFLSAFLPSPLPFFYSLFSFLPIFLHFPSFLVYSQCFLLFFACLHSFLISLGSIACNIEAPETLPDEIGRSLFLPSFHSTSFP